MVDDLWMKEIEEDVRRDRLRALWRKFGTYVVVLSLLVVSSTVGMVVWENHSASLAQERTQRLLDGLSYADKKDYTQSIAILQPLWEEEQGDFKAIAGIYLAQIYRRAAQPEAARSIWLAIQKQLPENRVWKDYTQHLLALYPAEGDPTAPLNVQDPWWLREAAAIDALQNNPNRARTLLEGLAEDAVVPERIRKRAKELLAVIPAA